MLNWGNENLLFLQSAPVKVRFAGWESTTHQLQAAGWQLAIRREFDLSMRPDLSIQLALKHEQARLFALARPLTMDISEIHEHLSMGREQGFINFMKDKYFEVFCVAPDIVERQIVPTHNYMPSSFMPIDASPQYTDLKTKDFSLEDLAIFRPLNPDSEIVVHPSMIPELLGKIRNAQAPKQKEIREKKRKEEMRKAVREKLNGEMDGYEPAKDIKATIVAVGE